jgi:multiple sugar transport system permease protein
MVSTKPVSAPAALGDSAASPTRRRGKTVLQKRENRAAYLFLAPWFVGLALITIGPIVASLVLSFTDYSLLESPNWIGFENYERMLDDPRLLNSLRVTFTYVFVSVPFVLALALALAMVLDRGLRGLPFYRSVYYLPSLLGGSVAIAILWKIVFGPTDWSTRCSGCSASRTCRVGWGIRTMRWAR